MATKRKPKAAKKKPAKKVLDVPEVLAESDMAYHKRLMQQLNAAQQALAVADGALKSWAAHLKEAYELKAEDYVNPQGEVIRSKGGDDE